MKSSVAASDFSGSTWCGVWARGKVGVGVGVGVRVGVRVRVSVVD